MKMRYMVKETQGEHQGWEKRHRKRIMRDRDRQKEQVSGDSAATVNKDVYSPGHPMG
jgi:hypothetical protein